MRYCCCCPHCCMKCSRCCCALWRATRRLCSIPCFKFMFIFTIVIFVIVPYLSINIPFSKLYQKYHVESDVFKQAKQLNEQRLDKALQYFKEIDNQTSIEFYKKHYSYIPDIVVCIVTVSRTRQTAKTGYLIQTAAAVDRILKRDKIFTKTQLFVCNVDRNPDKHNDAVMLQSYIPYIQKNGTNFWNMTFPTLNVSLLNKDKHRGQELADYTFCLNASLTWGSAYVLMLEDDVVPYDNIFEVLHYTTTQHKFIHNGHAEAAVGTTQKFSFIKLYYPERWQGYANEADRIIELACVGLSGGGLIFLMVFLCAKVCRLEFTYKTQVLYYGLSCFLMIFIALMVGRQNVMELRRFSPQLFRLGPTPACCTPAMFYSSSIIPGLMKYLLEHTEVHKDLAIYDFIRHYDIPGYILEPNLVRHIGMYTSLQDAHKSPFEFMWKLR